MSAQLPNQVRIIAGQWRRRLLRFPAQQGLRPTPDRVRETVFNWLGQDCSGVRCLDLFAGSGAMGFEAASRDAARVVMVELARPVLQALRDNAALLGARQIEPVASDALRYLAGCREQFDLVFVDPPYASGLLSQVLDVLPRVLAPGAVVYVEDGQPLDTAGWDVLRSGKAGQVHYALLRQNTECKDPDVAQSQ